VRSSGSLGFLRNADDSIEREAQAKIESELKKTFRPEFLNRIDEIITFSPLSLDEMIEIVELQMNDVEERLEEHGITVEVTQEAQKWLAEIGFDPDFGARPLKRALQKRIESPLSVKLLAGEFNKGDTIIVEVEGDEKELVFKGGKKKKAKKKEAESVEA